MSDERTIKIVRLDVLILVVMDVSCELNREGVVMVIIGVLILVVMDVSCELCAKFKTSL